MTNLTADEGHLGAPGRSAEDSIANGSATNLADDGPAPAKVEVPTTTSADDAASPRAEIAGTTVTVVRAPRAVSPARARRRGLRRRARLVALGCAFAPGLWIVLGDLARRARHIVGFDRVHMLGYLGTVVGSLVLWALLLGAASGRRGLFRQIAAGIFAVLFTLAVGVQGAFNAIFNVYAGLDPQFYSKSLPYALVGTLPFERPVVVAHFALALVLALALLVIARRRVRPRRKLRLYAFPLLAPAAIVGAFMVPASFRQYQSTTPDLIYFHSLTGYVKDQLRATRAEKPSLVRVQRRHPEPVPALTAKPARPRNVLFILQESQRADVTCTEYQPRCTNATRASNDLTPNRLPLLQMRAAASSTAVAISNIWANVDPTESRERLLSAPLLWEYAHAAGWDTAYWTSQNVMFGNMRLYVQDLPVSHYAYATNLDREADWLVGARDELLADRVIEEWGELKEPFFAVVHYSNVHRPRLYDKRFAPFQPSNTDDKGTKGAQGRNHYKNSVYLSDLAVAKLIRHVRSTEAGQRTVIVYTSDHGESFREHKNENDHSATVYDEEIRVPAWIDAPSGTLAPEEEMSLRNARTELVWQYDLGATLLDLVGVWDDPGMARFREKMIGHPITRPERTTEPVPMTNTSWIWEYHAPNWGMMQGPLKVLAQTGDRAYECYDVLADPGETKDLGEARCASLVAATRAKFAMMPREAVHLAHHPSWPRR